MTLLKRLRQKVYSIASNYVSHATLVEGNLKDTGQQLRCLFVEESNLKGYLLPRMYGQTAAVLKEWRILIPTITKIVKDNPYSVDICVAVIPNEYDRKFIELCDFKTQEYVCQIINTSGSWEQITGRFHSKKRQYAKNLIQKNDLNYKISRDLKDFDFFYQRMFIPHIQQKYKELSYIDKYDEMKEYFLKGFLLFVMDRNQAIAGALCFVENKSLIFRRTGVLDGDGTYIKKGAEFALYYFNIQYAYRHGLLQVDTMKSRPIITDGVYRTKREWGAVTRPDDESECWVYFFILRHSENIVKYFENNPMVIHTEEGLGGIVGWMGTTDLTKEDKNNLWKRLYSPGLENLFLLRPNSKEMEKVFLKHCPS